MEESTKKVLIIGIVVIAVLAIVACVACVGFGSQPSSTPSTSTGGYSNPSTNYPAQSSPATYRVGEIVNVNNYNPCQFSVQQIMRGQTVTNLLMNENMFNSEPDPGYEYVMYKVWIKNTGSGKLSVASYNFPIFGNGVKGEYVFAVLPSSYHTLSSVELLSGGETSGWIISEVPANSDCIIAYENILGTVYAYVQL